MNNPDYHAAFTAAISLIEERTGLAASMQLRADLDNALYNLSQGDVAGYVERLRYTSEHGPEWQALIGALTIGETYFLRDQAHFDWLKQRMLPELVLRRRQEKKLRMRIWSAGCASGEEPYSIALTLREFLPDLERWELRLIGTDINSSVLARAERGVYRPWAFRHTDDGFRRRYFTPVSEGSRIRPEIQIMVQFRRMNLLNNAPLPEFDLIFCRHVLLYFSRIKGELAEDILYQALAPGGWLVMGQAEALRHKRERWITHVYPGAAIYQKPLEQGTHSERKVDYALNGLSTPAPPRPAEPTADDMATYAAAVNAVQADNYTEAERLLAKLLASQPNHARARTLLAFIFASRQAFPEAQAQLETALRLEPLLADAHYMRALLHMEDANIEAARQSLQAALYCERDHVLAAFMLGNLHAQAGNLTRAYSTWQQARRALQNMEPEDPVSDLTEMTARQFDALLARHLEDA